MWQLALPLLADAEEFCKIKCGADAMPLANTKRVYRKIVEALNRRQRKLPVYLLVALSSILVFSLFNYFYTIMGTARYEYRSYVLRRERKVIFYSHLGERLGKTGMLEDLHAQLEEARRDHDIDFYLARNQDEPMFLGDR